MWQKGNQEELVCSKKDCYGVKTLAMSNVRNTEKTLVSRTQGTKIAPDGLKDHVLKVRLIALQDGEVAFRKSKQITEAIQGTNCLTNFCDIHLTHEKMCSMFKKMADHNLSSW